MGDHAPSGIVVSLIAAIAANRVIGRDGTMPWRIPDDMARFKRITTGHAVIMGRATFASMGRPLSGRQNIVLSRDATLRIPGCTVAHSRDEALRAVRSPAAGAPVEVFIIGGAAIYALFLPVAERIYVTWVDAEIPGDTLFPEVAWDDWLVTSETTVDDARVPHRFTDYTRRQT